MLSKSILYSGINRFLSGIKLNSILYFFSKYLISLDKLSSIYFLTFSGILIFTVFALVVGFILSSTIYGKQLYLIGTNPITAKYSGIKVDRIKLMLFTLSGLVSGVAGVLTTSRLAVARFNMATGAELEIVLMVMLGGTYIFGGRGNIFGTFVAFWIVVILRAGLNVARIKIESQLTILGTMLIIAIILTNYIYSKSQK